MNILYIIHLEPRYDGSGPYRLSYDILKAYTGNATVDFCVFLKDKIQLDLIQYAKFIPWSNLCIKHKKQIYVVPKKINPYKTYGEYTLNVEKYDKIIFQTYNLTLLKLYNCHAKLYTLGMDSAPMLYLRGLVVHHKLFYKLFCFIDFLLSFKIDRRAAEISRIVFTVGEDDAAFYRAVFKANVCFLPHPYNTLVDDIQPCVWGGEEKLRLCIPGGISYFYTGELLNEILDILLDNTDYYLDKISISFLGKIRFKSLSQRLDKLKESGITFNYDYFVDSFEKYIASHHVIILPVSVGAGTKNRAVSSAAIGLDFIGTPIALENVYGVKNINIAHAAKDFINQLEVRLSTKQLYPLSQDERMMLRERHSRDIWYSHFWKIVVGD